MAIMFSKKTGVECGKAISGMGFKSNYSTLLNE